MRTRRALLGLAVLFFVNGLALGSWLPRLPELRDSLGLSFVGLGFALAVTGIGGLVGSALAGWTVNRFGSRRSAVGAALFLFALLPMLAVVPHPAAFVAVLSAISIADAIADVGMNALAARVEEARGGSIFSRLHAVWSLGSLVGAAFSTLSVAAGVPLTAQLFVTGVLALVAVAWTRGVLPSVDARPRVRSHQRIVVTLALAGVTAAALEGIPSDWGPIFMVDALGASPTAAGAAFLCLSAGMLAGRLVGDFFLDLWGGLRTLVASLALVAVGVIGTVLTQGPFVALAAMIAWGLGVSTIFPLLYQLAGSRPGYGEAVGMAALTLGSRLGFLAGPPAVGLAAAALSLRASLGLTSLVALAAAAVVTLATVRE